MFSMLSNLISRPTSCTKSSAPAPSARAPRLESLEDRQLLAANLVNGNLIISQSNFNDSAVVTNSTFLGIPTVRVQETINGVSQTARTFFQASITGRIYYYGFAGNDYFDNQTSIRSNIYGSTGNDYLIGGHNSDIMDGGDGNDQMHAREGNDLMYGGYGNDLMRAGQGNDSMYGGYGVDDMFGADGNDYLDGGRDGVSDILRGGNGADRFRTDPRRILIFTINRDAPQDFNASQGDQMTSL